MKYLIFGSCVSRDIFDYAGQNKSIANYYARQSLISTMSKPVPVEMEDITLDSLFQKRMLYYDCNKSFRSELHSTSFDILVIDFIDERFAVRKIKDYRSFITLSQEAINAKLEDILNTETVAFHTKHTLWPDSCRDFAQLLKPYEKKIILHEAYWATHYMENEKAVPFKGKVAESVCQHNTYLKEYYALFKSQLQHMNVIFIENPAADPAHKWGLAPIHYTRSYYESQYEQIQNITKKQQKTDT